MRLTNSAQIPNWFDPRSTESIYLVTYEYKVELHSKSGNKLDVIMQAT